MTAVVGRDRELEAIGAFLDSSQGERVLVLEGEAGIGKTTLWREAVQAARDRDFRVLTASGSPSETKLAFAAIGDLFDGVMDEVLPKLPPPQARALTVALLRVDAEGAPPEPATIAVAVLASLRELAARGSVLVAVDDVQWLDAPSAASLAFSLRRLGAEEVRFIFAQRTYGETALPLGLDRYPDELLTQVEFGPLSLGAVSALVTSRFGTALPRPIVRRVHETANGNPFFVLELARALVRVGGRVAPGEPLPVPSTLDELLAARLVALPVATRAALLPVAAMREPTIELLVAVDDDALASLQPAVDAHVIEIHRDGVRFAHPLLAAAVYGRADRDARRRTHRALASIAPTVEERARHRGLAGEPPDDEVARELDEAARVAVAHGSPATAAELSELAARFTGPDHVDEQLRRLCDAADYYLPAGDVARACAIAARIVDNAPKGVHRARALSVLSFAEPDTSKRIALGEQAVVEAAGMPELEARIFDFLAMLAVAFRSVEEGRAYAERAIALSQTDLTRAQSTGTLALVEFSAGKTPDDKLLQAAIQVEEASGVSLAYGPSTVRALGYMFTDRLDEARAAFDFASRRASYHGDEHMIAGLLLHRAELESRAGNFSFAAEIARSGYAMAEQFGLPDRIAAEACGQAIAHGFLGDVELTRAKAAEASRLPGLNEIQAHAALGSLELSLGDVTAAAAVLRPLPDRLFAMGYGEAFHLQAVPLAIEALAELGELDEAERLLDLYAERAASPLGRAATARSRAIVAAARGELGVALGSFAEALARTRCDRYAVRAR